MKNILMVTAIAAMLFAAESFTPGYTPILQSDHTAFSVDTIGNSGTLYSAEYMWVGDHEGVTCMHLVVDSVPGQDSVSFDVILEEGFYTGVYKLSTTIFSYDALNAPIDTVFDFSFQPTPRFRFNFTNVGAGSADSITIDSVGVYSEPAE